MRYGPSRRRAAPAFASWSRRPGCSRVSFGCGSTGSPATPSARSSAARTGPAPCSRSARPATRLSRVPNPPPSAYASRPLTQLSPSPRSTFLGFQPPAIGEEEIAAVAETLRSGWLTTGPRAAELERRMAEYLEAEHVLALASGTAALHLALVALGVGPGDEVITTTITWP